MVAFDTDSQNELDNTKQSTILAGSGLSAGSNVRTIITPAASTKTNLLMDTKELWQFVNKLSCSPERNVTECTMTSPEKEMLYRAVQSGDIDLVDELMFQLPTVDINMTWFCENLLMAALRSRQSAMAIFLLDNGIDHNYSTARIDTATCRNYVADFYPISCRQMAYELDMHDVVDVIDELNDELWPKAKKTERMKRLRRTRQPPRSDDLSQDNSSATSGEAVQVKPSRHRNTLSAAVTGASTDALYYLKNASMTTPQSEVIKRPATSHYHVVFCPSSKSTHSTRIRKDSTEQNAQLQTIRSERLGHDKERSKTARRDRLMSLMNESDATATPLASLQHRKFAFSSEQTSPIQYPSQLHVLDRKLVANGGMVQKCLNSSAINIEAVGLLRWYTDDNVTRDHRQRSKQLLSHLNSMPSRRQESCSTFCAV
jgi:hypothetical protein